MMAPSRRRQAYPHLHHHVFPKKYRVGETTLDESRGSHAIGSSPGMREPAHRRRTGCHESAAPGLIWHMDEPTADPALITAYLVCPRGSEGKPRCCFSGGGRRERTFLPGYRKYLSRTITGHRNLVGCLPQPAVLTEGTLAALPKLARGRF